MLPDLNFMREESVFDKSKIENRRSFLKKASIWGGAFAVGFGKSAEAEERRERGRELFEFFFSYLKEINNWKKEIETNFGLPNDRSLAQQDQVRELFLQSNLPKELDSLTEYLDTPQEFIKYSAEFDEIYRMLGEINCQGVLYAALRRHNAYVRRDSFLDATNLRKAHFSTKVKDFLPTGEEKLTSLDVGKNDLTDDVKTKWLDMIENAKGKSLFVVNTHGAESSFVINHLHPGYENNVVNYSDIARALISRVNQTGDPNCLKNITFIFNQCHNYDFTKNIFSAMKFLFDFEQDGETIERKAIKWQDITMPTIIAGAQEGSLVWHDDRILETLVKYVGGIKKDGGLVGKRILATAQPEIYWSNDVVVFAGEKGKIVEIAGQTKPSEDRPV